MNFLRFGLFGMSLKALAMIASGPFDPTGFKFRNDAKKCVATKGTIKKTSCVMILLLLSYSACAFSNVYYVDIDTGNDGNDGMTESTAWKNVARLNEARLLPGDKVLFRRGRVWNDTIRVKSSGNPARSIVYGAYGNGPRPVIDLNYKNGSAFHCNKSYVTLQHLEFRNTRNNTLVFIESSGIRISDVKITYDGLGRSSAAISDIGRIGNNGIAFMRGGNHIRLDSVTVLNALNNGILFKGHPSQHISDVSVRDSYVRGAVFNDCITVHEDGHHGTAGTNFHFENNKVEGCGEQGFDITTGADVFIKDNVSRRNGEGGIMLGHSASSVVIDGHLSIDEPVKKTAAAVLISVSDVTLRDSIIRGKGYHLLKVVGLTDRPVDGIVIKRNRFEWSGGGSVFDIAGNVEGLTVRRNRFTSATGSYRSNASIRRVIRFRDERHPPGYSKFDFDQNAYESLDGSVRFQMTMPGGTMRSFRVERLMNEFKQEKGHAYVRPPGSEN